MRKLLYFIWFTCAVVIRIHAQSDSLISHLEQKLTQQINLSGQSNLEVASLYDSLGVLHQYERHFDKADSLFIKGLNIKLKILDAEHNSISRSYYLIGSLYSKQHKFEKADSCLNMALSISRKSSVKEAIHMANCYARLSKNSYKNSKFKKADSLSRKSLSIYKSKLVTHHKYLVDNYNHLAVVNWRLDNYDIAEQYFNASIEEGLIVYGKESVKISPVYHNLGLLLLDKSEFDQAEESIKKSIELFIQAKMESYPNLSAMYNNLGVVHRRKSNYVKAIAAHNKALDLAIKVFGEESKIVGSCHHSIGIAFLQKGDFVKAENKMKIALNIFKKTLGTDNHFVGSVYSNLGNCALKMGDLEQAIVYYNKALQSDLLVYGEQHRNTAKSYYYLSERYRVNGDYKKAIEYINKAIAIYIHKNDPRNEEVANYYQTLAKIYIDIAAFDQAESIVHQAIDIYKEKHSENSRELASCYDNLGSVLYGKAYYSKAGIYYKKAMNIWKNVFSAGHYNNAIGYNNLGNVEYKLGRYKSAENFYNKAIQINENAFGKKHPNKIDSYINLAKVKTAQHEVGSADSLWELAIHEIVNKLYESYTFLPEAQRVKFMETYKRTYSNFLSYAAERDDELMNTLAAYLLLNTKSLALDFTNSVRELIRNSDSKELQNEYKALNDLSLEISQAELLTNEEREEKNWNLVSMNYQLESSARKLLQHEDLKANVEHRPLQWQELYSDLDPSVALLDFTRFYDENYDKWMYYALLTSKSSSSPIFIPITEQADIADLLANTGPDLQPNYIQSDEGLKALYKKIWTALNPFLKEIKLLNVSATGLLHKIDFEALQSENGTFLAEQFEFQYFNNLRDYIKSKDLKPSLNAYQSATLLGGITYDEMQEIELQELAVNNLRDGIDPLPATLEEVNFVAKLMESNGGKCTILKGIEATEKAIKDITGKNSPHIFHFATHAKYLSSIDSIGKQAEMQGRLQSSGNPLQRSMLMLSGANTSWTSNEYIPRSENDGVLTAYEVTQMDFRNTELVVLSACNTGLGDIHDFEGVLGLQNAFKKAGVKHVLVSLWKVNDVAAKDLMVAFYDNLLKKKQDASIALRNAKASMREQGAKPMNWAGFVLL